MNNLLFLNYSSATYFQQQQRLPQINPDFTIFERHCPATLGQVKIHESWEAVLEVIFP